MFKAEYVFVRVLIPLICGIWVTYYLPSVHLLNGFVVAAELLLTLLFIINIAYKSRKAYRFKGYTAVLIFSFFFAFGGCLCLWHNQKLQPDYFGTQKYPVLKVWVNNEPEQSADILRFKTQVVQAYRDDKTFRVSGQLLLALKLDTIHPIKLKYGDELLINANYLPVEPPYNPAEFDFKAWLASQNVYDQAFINQNHLIKTGQNTGNPIIKMALALRAKQILKYRKLIKNNEAFAVASTLILGYRADLSAETLSAYAKTGTIHALSVSGSHVAIIFFILDFTLLFLDKKRGTKLLKLLLICGSIWFYSLISGLSPSVVRSAIMISIFIVAKTFAKNKNSYNSLAFAAFCQLVYQPFLWFDVGFQLSYLSVFGLIYLQPKIYAWLYVPNKWLDKIWSLVALSLSAQIITFPLAIYYFHQFPIYFLLGNLFISLPLLLMMILGIAILFPFLDHLAPALAWLININNSVLKWIADLPFSTVSTIWIDQKALFLLILALGFIIYGLAHYQKKILYTGLVCYFIYQGFVTAHDLEIIKQKKIIFFSLRKNYAAAFITGQKAILITDLKQSDKNFQFFVAPALSQLQILKTKWLSLKSDTLIDDLLIKNHQIIFNRQKIFVVDAAFNQADFEIKGSFNHLWLTENHRFALEKIPQSLRFQSILVDATNKDYKIEAHQKFAENNHFDVHILKKNPAYLVDLSP